MKTIILADNQDITKAGILYVCMKLSGISRIIEANKRDALLKALTAHPDSVVILDYSLFDINGREELLIIQERFQAARWLIFSDYLSEDFIRGVVFGSDTIGVVFKDSTLEELRSAIQNALQSERYLSNRVSNMLANKKTTHEKKETHALTNTEAEILKAIALGKTTKEIAAGRFSSIHTITTHRKNIFRKLDVNNIHEATKYALRAGIVDSAEYYI